MPPATITPLVGLTLEADEVQLTEGTLIRIPSDIDPEFVPVNHAPLLHPHYRRGSGRPTHVFRTTGGSDALRRFVVSFQVATRSKFRPLGLFELRNDDGFEISGGPIAAGESFGLTASDMVRLNLEPRSLDVAAIEHLQYVNETVQKRWNDPAFNVAYEQLLAGNGATDPRRIAFEFVVGLEALLLSPGQELRFRFAAILSLLMSRAFRADPGEWFGYGKALYDARNGYAHGTGRVPDGFVNGRAWYLLRLLLAAFGAYATTPWQAHRAGFFEFLLTEGAEPLMEQLRRAYERVEGAEVEADDAGTAPAH